MFYLISTNFLSLIYADVLSQFICLNIVVVFQLHWHVRVWLCGVVVSTLGMRTRRPRFESQVAPLFHLVATLGKLFTHIASPVSQLQETGVQKGVFGV